MILPILDSLGFCRLSRASAGYRKLSKPPPHILSGCRQQRIREGSESTTPPASICLKICVRRADFPILVSVSLRQRPVGPRGVQSPNLIPIQKKPWRYAIEAARHATIHPPGGPREGGSGGPPVITAVGVRKIDGEFRFGWYNRRLLVVSGPLCGILS